MLDDFEEINVKSESVQALKKNYSKPSVPSEKIVKAQQKNSIKPDEQSSILIQSESDVMLQNKQKYLKWKSEEFLQKNNSHVKTKLKREKSHDLVSKAEAYSKVSKNQLIFCLTCGDDFCDFQQLSNHIEKKIECRSSLNEIQLKRKFKKPSASKPENNEDQFVIQHNDKITGTTMYKCSICDTISYHSKSTLAKHISQSHYGQNSQNPLRQQTSSGSIKVFRQAQRIFEKEKLITYSYDNKVGPLYKCTICGTAYNAKSSVVMHIKKYHDGPKIIENKLLQEKELLIKKFAKECGFCSSKFSDSLDLQKHIEVVHNVIKLNGNNRTFYKCVKCEKMFSQKSNILQHNCKRQIFVCSKCDISFSRVNHFNIHMKTVHEELKPHKCLECDISFSQSSKLIKHIEKNHTLPIASETMFAYKCASCEKTFSEKSNLLQHLHQHITKTTDSNSDILEKSEPEVAVKEELNSVLDIDDDFLQNFDDLQNVATDPLAT